LTIPSLVLNTVSVAFWAALVSATFLAYPIYRLLLLTKSRQTVSQHLPGHQSKQGTPTMGGLIIVAGFVLATWAVATTSTTVIASSTLAIFIGFAAIGFIDDFVVPRLIKGKRGLGWKQKFLMQAVVAGVGVYYHSGHVFDLRWGIITFIVLFMANAYNFADGLDALAGSILLIFCVGLFVLSLEGMVIPEPALIAAALIGAVIPFLFLNAPPAKVFMGDAGSLPIGAVLGLAVASIASPRAEAFTSGTDVSILQQWLAQRQIEGTILRAEMIVPLTILCMLMIFELVPVPMQIFWVKVFKRRLFPFTPIHHAFEKAGWPESRVVWTFALSQLVFVALAILVFRAPDLTQYHRPKVIHAVAQPVQKAAPKPAPPGGRR
jgi:phospho-N-acetylmuramoyl-pentapeptide-transferase